MELKIVRYGLQIIPTEHPIDDIIIEEILGLRKTGDCTNLTRLEHIKKYYLEAKTPTKPKAEKAEAAAAKPGDNENIESECLSLTKGEDRKRKVLVDLNTLVASLAKAKKVSDYTTASALEHGMVPDPDSLDYPRGQKNELTGWKSLDIHIRWLD